MRLGVDYYPEHWPEERWPTDAKLMREAGITVVRLAEFAWCRMEPREDLFDFDWLRRAIDVLAAEGIQTILCTPTPTPPAWLCERYPDTLPMDWKGHVHGFGMRHHRCLNGMGYRERSAIICSKLAGAFAACPHVIGWQTDNEFGCHGSTFCYCDNCAVAFRAWLKNKYGTLRDLNRVWGTVFWSQEYISWEQVPLPRYTRGGWDSHSPSLLLDYRRFASQQQVEFQAEQIGILRSESPGRFITHNLMGLFNEIDYFQLGEQLDFVSWDNYPFGAGANYIPAGLGHDVMRGIKQKNFWVMEQASGPGGWNTFAPTPRPGQMRLWVYQAVGHGADTISFFRWRSCRWGTEQYWHGLLYHDGEPRRRYRELQQIAAEFKKLSPHVDGTEPRADVAILNDYDQIWAMQIQPQAHDGLHFEKLMRAYYAAVKRLGADADVIGKHADFSPYKLLILPPMYLADQAIADKLRAYAEAGGTIVLSLRSGVKDMTNVVTDQRLPGVFASLAGIKIDEYDAMPRDHNTVHLETTGRDYPIQLMADIIDPAGAAVAGTYGSDYYAGRAAITANSVGKGQVWYVGTVGDERFYDDFVGALLGKLGVDRVGPPPHGVEIVRRWRGSKPLTFVMNHNAIEALMPLGAECEDLLSGRRVSGQIELEPYGVMILEPR